MNENHEPDRTGPVAWVNGRLMPADAPALPVADRGFQLGDGVFETLRVRRGVAAPGDTTADVEGQAPPVCHERSDQERRPHRARGIHPDGCAAVWTSAEPAAGRSALAPFGTGDRPCPRGRRPDA